jgi:rhamnogalacturonyl hydrolase YesR
MEKKSNLPYVNVPETIFKSPEKKETEKWLRLLAGYIFTNTSYKFIDYQTGDSFENSNNIPVKNSVKLQSMFNDWKYWNGVNHMALKELSEILNDKQYFNYAKKNYTFFFENIEWFQKMFDARIPGASGHQIFRLDRLDDFGAMAAGLFDVFEEDSKENYKNYLELFIEFITKKQDRLDDGTFCRRRFGYTQIWGDDLYMSVPFLIRAWKYTGNDALLEDAVQQVFNFKKYLFRKENGLYFHYRTIEEDHPGVAHWGRANGWMIVAQCQLLEFLPHNHPKRNDLISQLKEHIIGISRFQSANGMWRQLLDKTDSFLESSCTAMYTYGIAKAINKGWIGDIYATIAINGWNALIRECIGANGYFDKVTTGFNYKQDLPFYYNMPIEPGGDHGIGAAIYAGIEIYKLKEEYRDCIWC